MPFPEAILNFAALLFLIGYLWLKSHQRERIRRETKSSCWNGNAIDTTLLVPKLQKIRQTYSLGTISNRNHHSHRQNLIALARVALGRLSYFRRTENEVNF